MKKQNTPKLRFAALIRVSTEQQEQTGESLRTQKGKLIKDVELLGGEIVGWYGGQEHAMPGYEKKEIDRLLDDASKQKFNAVIVTKADRWSRDNKTSQRGIDVFKKNKIRFYASVTEYDLYNPDHLLILGMSAVIGQFFGNNQSKESLLNRIARAKRNVPTAGKLPYGRTFDKKTEQWGIDIEKQALAIDCANRYLQGENIVHLAEEYGVNYTSLFKTLMHRSGEEWELKFDSDDFNIHEVVKLKIPRLLPENVIQKLHERSRANKTYTHGKIKTPYLLSRMIFCEHCGYALSGSINHGNRRYRHVHTKRIRKCDGNHNLIEADVIEDMVMRHLFEMFGNPKAVERAIEKAVPDLKKVKESQQQIGRLRQQIDQIDRGRDKVLKWALAERISDGEADKQLLDLKKKKERFEKDLKRLNDYVRNVPNAQKIKFVANRVSSGFAAKRRAIGKKINTDFESFSYEDKRSLMEAVFSGQRPDGSRMGVYVKWIDEDWTFSIRGHLTEIEGLVPLSDESKKAVWGDFSDNPASHQKGITNIAWH